MLRSRQPVRMNSRSRSGKSGSCAAVRWSGSAIPTNVPSRERMRAMCGLLTFISPRGEAYLYRDAIAEALESLHHRGPDDTGVEVVGSDVIFAHKRLSIIDVAGSHEPLPYLDGRYVLTFNGEIYNYIELREELMREFGARFETQGDGEVVV